MMIAWRACVVVGLAFVGVAGSTVLAQASDPAKPAAKDKDAHGAGEQTQPAAEHSVKAEFPGKKAKKLYATNDYRGRKAPELKVEKWLTKEPDRKGKVVLIDFWATWCPPCRALIPELNDWQKEFKDDLVVIGVSDEPEDKVRGFMGKTKVDYAMAVDTRRNETTKGQLGVQGIPHVMVIDSTGVCRWQGFPQSNEETLTTDVLRQIIAADKKQRGEQGDKPAEKPKGEAPKH
jgi:thiol-disulfide isomerase/thioredoxin